MPDNPGRINEKSKAPGQEKDEPANRDEAKALSLLSVSGNSEKDTNLLKDLPQKNSVGADFVGSLGYSIAQSPLEAVAQLAQGKSTGAVTDAVKFMEAPKPAEFKTANWAAQQAGHIAGSLVWIVGLHSTISASMGKTMLKEEANLALAAANRSAMQESARHTLIGSGLTGLTYGGLLMPAAPGDQNFWYTRGANAVVQGSTFTALTGATLGFKSVGAGLATTSTAEGAIASSGARSVIGSALRNDIVANTFAGAPAGFLNSHMDSFAKHGKAATLQQQTETMLAFSALGAGIGLGQRFVVPRLMGTEAPKSGGARQAESENPFASEYKPTGDYLAVARGGKTAPEAKPGEGGSGTQSGVRPVEGVAEAKGTKATDSSSEAKSGVRPEEGVAEAKATKAADGSTEPKSVAKPAEKEVEQSKSGAKSEAEKLDVDGRPVESGMREKVASQFPEYSKAELKQARVQTEAELSEIRSSETGKSVMDRLSESPLSAEQKSRVLDSLGRVREEYVRQKSNDGKMDADQEVNWIHTQGELGRVIDVALETKVTPAQLEDALLASMFSDSVKAKSNFFTHHLDGALAADHVLRPMLGGDFTPARLDGITHAIREHQIGPPEFMAMLYGGRIRGALLQEKGSVTAEETDALKRLFMKMSNPLSAEVPKVRSANGGVEISFAADELALLKRAGVDSWSVPDATNPWNTISRLLIDGDSIDNYATAGGFGKIAKIRGPESDQWFKDRRIDNAELAPGNDTSLGSARLSKKQAEKAMTPIGQELMNRSVAETERAVANAKDDLITWLRKEKGLDATKQEVPFLNKDLKYPQRSAEMENEWWRVHRKPEPQRSADESKFYQDHRYEGMSPSEIADFQLAAEMRDRVVASLRRAQRVQNDNPPAYAPAIRN